MTENSDDTTEMIGAVTGGVMGTAAGIGGGIATISASGTVAGLSGAGITSGLAAIGGTVVGGMAIVAGATVLLAAGGAWGGYKLLQRWKTNDNGPNPSDDKA